LYRQYLREYFRHPQAQLELTVPTNRSARENDGAPQPVRRPARAGPNRAWKKRSSSSTTSRWSCPTASRATARFCMPRALDGFFRYLTRRRPNGVNQIREVNVLRAGGRASGQVATNRSDRELRTLRADSGVAANHGRHECLERSACFQTFTWQSVAHHVSSKPAIAVSTYKRSPTNIASGVHLQQPFLRRPPAPDHLNAGERRVPGLAELLGDGRPDAQPVLCAALYASFQTPLSTRCWLRYPRGASASTSASRRFAGPQTFTDMNGYAIDFENGNPGDNRHDETGSIENSTSARSGYQ
jgi:hypothetical protein